MTTKKRYSHTYDHGGETVRLGVHCSGPASEPRVRWQVAGQRGERGYVRLSDDGSVVRLEDGETTRLGERLVSAIPVPPDIGEVLQDECEALGTVVVDGDRVSTDPAAFPEAIASFSQVGWEPDRNVMWYWRDARSSPRAYQIEHGELVFRAQEWADPEITSKTELVDRYGLTTAF